MQAIWKDHMIAKSDEVLIVGTECYFPVEAVQMELLEKNAEVAYCSDKGYGVYFDLVLPSERVHNIAWSYPHPYTDAAALKGKVGFKRTMLS